MGVQFDPILEPRYVRSGQSLCHAEESDFSAQHVVQLKMGSFHNGSAL